MAKKTVKKTVKKANSKVTKKSTDKTNSKKDAWGRKIGSQSATINTYLAKGSTIEKIIEKEVYPRSRITGHIKFLKSKDFKLTETKTGVLTLHKP